MSTKKELLKTPIQHIDIKQHNVVALVDAMASMAYSSRDLARAANIYDMMLRDTDCGVILCLAGSLIREQVPDIYDRAALEFEELRSANKVSREEYHWLISKLQAERLVVVSNREPLEKKPRVGAAPRPGTFVAFSVAPS